MMADEAIAPPADEKERAEFARLFGLAFNFPEEYVQDAFRTAGTEGIRLLRENGQALGGLNIIPMGQWFGGAAVPTAGVAWVAVAPEARGRGIARRLMTEMLREVRAAGTPISTLYPSTVTLYRRCGYERAGLHAMLSISPRDIGISDRGLELRPIREQDIPAVDAAYRLHASRHNGFLDRGPYIWNRRVRQPMGKPTEGYLAARGDRVEGYLYYRASTDDVHTQRLRISDLVANTPEAARRLLTFLADHRSIASEAQWFGSPMDPLLMHLPERFFTVTIDHYWMLRIVDVAGALRVRGYPKGLSAEMHFEVRDDVLSENNGRWVLSLSEGRPEVRPRGDGRLKLDVRALAALYSGFLSATQLASAGMLECTAADAEAADAVFACRTPFLDCSF